MPYLNEEGNFEVVIVSNRFDKTKKGTDTLIVTFEDEEERHINGYFYFSDKAVERTIKDIRTMGFTGDDLMLLSEPILAGNRCNIGVKCETYEEADRYKVKFVNPAGWTGGMSNEDKMSLKAKLSKFNVLLKAEKIIPQQDNSNADLSPMAKSNENDAPF